MSRRESDMRKAQLAALSVWQFRDLLPRRIFDFSLRAWAVFSFCSFYSILERIMLILSRKYTVIDLIPILVSKPKNKLLEPAVLVE